MEYAWQQVAPELERIAVLGGWLYRTVAVIGVTACVAMTFVPDANSPYDPEVPAP